MKNKQKEDKVVAQNDAAIDSLNISTTVNNVTTNSISLKGKPISLNQKVEAFFGTSGKAVWLSDKKYSTVVPDNISPEEEQQLINALSQNILLMGDVYVPPIDKDPKVLDEYWELIKNYGLDPGNPKCKSFPKFSKLLKKPIDRNWTAKEITNYCMQLEAKGKNRQKILDLLKGLHKNVDCPATLLESR